jgi:hypothetical protein
MQIAVVHDYFTHLGGAEKVAGELVRMLPGASLHSAIALPDCMPACLAGVQVETSWMQHLPGIKQYYGLYFPLYPLAVRSLLSTPTSRASLGLRIAYPLGERISL